MASNSIRAILRTSTRNISARFPVYTASGINPAIPTVPFLLNKVKEPQSSKIGRPGRAYFSSNDDSHSDFAPKRAVIDGTDEAVEMIKVR